MKMVSNDYELVSNGRSSPQPPPRIPRPRSRKCLILSLVLATFLILGFIGDMNSSKPVTHRIAKSWGVNIPFTGGEGQPAGVQSLHKEAISIVLVVGNNDHGIMEVTNAMLALTVGPYELITVFAGPRDVSSDIVGKIVSDHQAADVDRLGRGLKGYTFIDMSSWEVNEEYNTKMKDRRSKAGLEGMKAAKYDLVAMLNADDMMAEYGWDRILLTGLKSSSNLLAVSGKAAANIEIQDNSLYSLTDILGEPRNVSHDVSPSGPTVEIRDVALRSPILYNMTKVESLGYMSDESESEGLGDIDLCLRGRQEKDWLCGYYPVSTTTKEEWNSVPGSLILDGAGSLPLTATDVLGLSQYAFLQDSGRKYQQIEAIPRRIEDIPITIVTAFSGNHQRSARHLHSTLAPYSPHTRLITYLMRSDRPICLDKIQAWNDTEIRIFDFDSRPDWMDLSKSKGEYAWKVQIIEEVIRDFGGLVLWLDTGDALVDDMRTTWVDIALRGVWTTPSGGPLSIWTHPAQLAYFDVPEYLWDKVNCNAANVGYNSHNARAMTKVTRPLIACSANRDCIAPRGSSRDNHRQDQAALTVLIHLNGYTCELHGPIETQRDDPTEWDEVCEGEVF